MAWLPQRLIWTFFEKKKKSSLKFNRPGIYGAPPFEKLSKNVDFSTWVFTKLHFFSDFSPAFVSKVTKGFETYLTHVMKSFPGDKRSWKIVPNKINFHWDRQTFGSRKEDLMKTYWEIGSLLQSWHTSVEKNTIFYTDIFMTKVDLRVFFFINEMS